MTVRLELTPDVEASLAAKALARGVALDVYLQGVIEELAHAEAPRSAVPDIATTLDALAEMGRGLPILPPSALSRESIYQDHN